jgi:hypothetical protein
MFSYCFLNEFFFKFERLFLKDTVSVSSKKSVFFFYIKLILFSAPFSDFPKLIVLLTFFYYLRLVVFIQIGFKTKIMSRTTPIVLLFFLLAAQRKEKKTIFP